MPDHGGVGLEWLSLFVPETTNVHENHRLDVTEEGLLDPFEFDLSSKFC